MGRLGVNACVVALTLVGWLGGASIAAAQAGAAPASSAAPAPAAPAAAPAPAPAPAAPAAAPAAPVPASGDAVAPAPAAAQEPAPAAAPVPPPAYPQAAPAAPAPAPQYKPLGGAPQELPKEGDWDPWAHVRQRRHAGFFLRLAIGIGGGALGGDDHAVLGGDVTVRGGGLATDIQIGGALFENFILHADIFQTTLFNPTVFHNDNELGDADSVGDAAGVGQDVRLTGLGIGVTYYFMPINLYVAGAIGLGQAVYEGDHGDTEGSDLGLGLNAMVGKEWWVGADWGIGAALQFTIVAAEDLVLGDIGGGTLNILFSATYN